MYKMNSDANYAKFNPTVQLHIKYLFYSPLFYPYETMPYNSFYYYIASCLNSNKNIFPFAHYITKKKSKIHLLTIIVDKS
jgi:hypothetical protein